MTTPDAKGAALVLEDDAGIVGRPLAPPSPTPKERRSAAKTNHQNIRVSPAVLDAARKDGEALFQDLGTSPAGLSQVEAEERARAKGPNEIAQERKQGWPIRIPKIIRNPLIVLLTLLSSVSFLTGDARAGSVMALMVVLSAGLRFFQEARADAAAEKLKAMIHVTATVVRDGATQEIPLRDLVPGGHRQVGRGRHDPRGRAADVHVDLLLARPKQQWSM